MQAGATETRARTARRARGAGDPVLVLFPTELERRRFRDLGGVPRGVALEAVCGFGPVAAAARTAALCARLRPRLVLLVGIAGTFDPERRPVGTAAAFGRVALDGVGAGQGRDHVGPAALGFPQWPGSTDAGPLDEVLALHAPGSDALLLTTCAASASPEEAALRRERHAEAIAEDMEGYAVALAAALADTPLAIARGFSNEVGDRDASSWRIPSALAAARRIALELLEAAP